MEMEQRVERLERDNRRMKLAVGGLVAVLLSVALVGAVMPQEVPDYVTARQAFQVVDENGMRRASMNVDGFAVLDADQTVRTWMRYYGFAANDENGTKRVVLSEAGIFYLDENETTRAHLGRVGLRTPSTGAETTYPAAAALYDAEGNVIWQAPR